MQYIEIYSKFWVVCTSKNVSVLVFHAVDGKSAWLSSFCFMNEPVKWLIVTINDIWLNKVTNHMATGQLGGVTSDTAA